MTLQTTHGRPHAESAEDLELWLTRMSGCPTVSLTRVLSCANPVHDGEAATWFYVQADPTGGVACRRCVGCGLNTTVLDSEQHWTHPAAWACRECGNCIVETAAGLSVDPEGRASWLALAVRCVECGAVAGATDLLLPGLPVDEVLRSI